MIDISIIVPTHNRRELLKELLVALGLQTKGKLAFEVIIVADGCQDGTKELLACNEYAFPVSLVELPGVGPSLARNAGAKHARADLLLFLDDDVIPTPNLVDAHARAHHLDGDRVVLGPYPPLPIRTPDLFRQFMQNWWKAHFARLASPGHKFRYSDLLTGNLSISRTVWERIGGLDPQFSRAREDIELGIRLMRAGIPFHFEPAALGWHYEHLTTTQRAGLRRKKEEGRSDARLLAKYPELAPLLETDRISRRRGILRRSVSYVVCKAGAGDTAIETLGLWLVNVMEKLGVVAWRNRVERLLKRYFYLRGALEGFATLTTPYQPKPYCASAVPTLDVDLRAGISLAEEILSEQRPCAARIFFGPHQVCDLPYMPASEPWDGKHLRPYLAKHAAKQLIPLLIEDKEGGASQDWRLHSSLNWIGATGYWPQVFENKLQWMSIGSSGSD